MSRVSARYAFGAAAGAGLATIVLWVVDQLRRDSSASGKDLATRRP